MSPRFTPSDLEAFARLEARRPEVQREVREEAARNTHRFLPLLCCILWRDEADYRHALRMLGMVWVGPAYPEEIHRQLHNVSGILGDYAREIWGTAHA